MSIVEKKEIANRDEIFKYVDYSEIVVGALNISTERYQFFKEEAEVERKRITRNAKFCNADAYARLVGRAHEFPNTNTTKQHANMTKAEKAILSANVVFDDESFSKKIKSFLAMKNYSMAYLVQYIKLLYFVQRAVEHNLYTSIENKHIKFINGLSSQLINYFVSNVGIDDITIIINKLNEVLSFNPELFDTKENHFTR